MQPSYQLKLNLQRFADGDASPIKLGEKEYTPEQLQEAITKAEAYAKLEPEFTRKSQKLSELEKQSEAFKEWSAFDAFLRENPTLATQVVDVINSFQNGKNVTTTDISAITKGIKVAEKSGDDETAQRLEQLESLFLEREIEQTFESLAKRAEKDGLDYNEDAFKEFAEKWLEEELEIGDEDEVKPKDIRQAYTAYKAHLLEETIKNGKIPRLGSRSAGVPDPTPPKDAPKGLAERAKQAKEYLARLGG